MTDDRDPNSALNWTPAQRRAFDCSWLAISEAQRTSRLAVYPPNEDIISARAKLTILVAQARARQNPEKSR